MADTKIPFEKLKTEASTDQLLGFNGSGIPTLFNQSDFNNDSAFATEDLTGGDNADKMIIEDQTDGLQKFITLGALGTLIGGGGGGSTLLGIVEPVGPAGNYTPSVGCDAFLVLMVAAGGSGSDGTTVGTDGGDVTFSTFTGTGGQGGRNSSTTSLGGGGSSGVPVAECTGFRILTGARGSGGANTTGLGLFTPATAGPPAPFFGYGAGNGGVGQPVNGGQGGGAGASGGGWVLSFAAPFTNAPYAYTIPPQTAGSGGTGNNGDIIIFEFGT